MFWVIARGPRRKSAYSLPDGSGSFVTCAGCDATPRTVRGPSSNCSGDPTMAAGTHIRNPIEWGWDQVKLAVSALSSTRRAVGGSVEAEVAARPAVRRIWIADLRGALTEGMADFGAYRTDVLFIALIYPVVGLVLVQFAFGQDLLPLLFPL